jgi:hypothetical protein
LPEYIVLPQPLLPRENPVVLEMYSEAMKLVAEDDATPAHKNELARDGFVQDTACWNLEVECQFRLDAFLAVVVLHNRKPGERPIQLVQPTKQGAWRLDHLTIEEVIPIRLAELGPTAGAYDQAQRLLFAF